MDPSNTDSAFENPRSVKGCLWIVVVTIVSVVGTFYFADVILKLTGM